MGEGDVLGEPHLLYESAPLKEYRQEQYAGDEREGGYLEEVGDVWGGREEDKVEDEADGQIEVEYRAVIGLSGVFFANEGRTEPAVDQDAREGDKEREDAYLAVIFGGEEIGEDNARDKIEQLLPAFVDETPNEGIEGSFFEGVGHGRREKSPPRQRGPGWD